MDFTESACVWSGYHTILPHYCQLLNRQAEVCKHYVFSVWNVMMIPVKLQGKVFNIF